ncbi:hypothetical protein BH11ARM2_BH11ARM2_05080 [soil metagenome]
MIDALKAFLDGEATPAEAKSVEAALESDATLREEREQFAAISSVLRNEVAEPRPIGFERTLMALAEAEKVRTTPPWMVWIPRVIAAAAVCAVVAIPSFFVKEPGLPSSDMAMKSAATASAPTMEGFKAKADTGAMVYSSDRDDNPALRTPPGAGAYAPDRMGMATRIYTPDRVQTQTGPPMAMPPTVGTPMPPRLRGSMTKSGPIEPFVPMQVEPLPATGAVGSEGRVLNAPKADLEFLEKAIRQAATASKGLIVGVSKLANASGVTGRTILVSLAPADAAAFAERVKKLVGAYGSVSDPIDASPEPKRIALKAAPAAAKPNASASADAVALGEVKKQIDDLKAKREELLKDYYEDAKPVKEIDAQIADLQKQSEAQSRQDSAPRKLVQVTLGSR